MKALLFLLLASLNMFELCPSRLPQSSESEDQPIVIIRKGLDPIPRQPNDTPFYAELEDSYVLLGSLGDYGDVSVELVSTAGDNYSTTFDTADGAIVIPVSGNAGYYVLTIITQSGQEFVGEFNI